MDDLELIDKVEQYDTITNTHLDIMFVRIDSTYYTIVKQYSTGDKEYKRVSEPTQDKDRAYKIYLGFVKNQKLYA